MKNQSESTSPVRAAGAARLAVRSVAALLAVEFLDELVFGVRESAWPLLRHDLGLSYVEVGLLLSLPALAANAFEPLVGLLADVRGRRVLVLGGGAAFGLALAFAAFSSGFWPLLAAFVLLSPASGAFVNLSQAALVDAAPDRGEETMARWALAGSAANAAAPFCLGAALALGLGWRTLFGMLALLSWLLVAGVRSERFGGPAETSHHDERLSLRAAFRDLGRSLRRPEILRWLVLLECADLMLDILLGYLTLYFVDVAGAAPERAAVAVAVWTLSGLPGDALLIPLLRRMDGLRYLRLSACAMLVLFPAFLLVPGMAAKLALLGAIGFLNAGWYSILKARLYGAMPGRSGSVMALGSLANLVGCLIPLAVGSLAQLFGLRTAMWLLLAGPVALLAGLPRAARRRPR